MTKIIISVILFANLIWSQSENTTLFSRWANGPSYTVAVSGDIAYLGNGGYLQILDISDPSNPIELAKILTPSVVRDIKISGNYAYVADWYGGLRIIDISTSSFPQEVGFYNTVSKFIALSVNGSYVYVVDGTASLHILDITTPSSPQAIGFIHTIGDSSLFGGINVAVSGGYAYVTSDGLHIIDVSNPSSPQEVGFLDTGDYEMLCITVDGNLAYVGVSYGIEFHGGLRIIDVSTPSSPQEVGHFENEYGGAVTGIAINDNYACVTVIGLTELEIIDISSPSSPQGMGSVGNRDDWGEEVTINGNYAYVAERGNGLGIFDISNHSSPQEAGFFFKSCAGVWSVSISGDYAYLEAGGLHIIDITNISSPREVVSIDTISGDFVISAEDIAISKNYINGVDYFEIIDISDPYSLQVAGSFSGDGGIAVSGNYAYVIDHRYLEIFDISIPSSPQIISSSDPGWFTARDITVSDNYVYVTSGYSGLYIIDVSIPSSPQKVGFFAVGSEVDPEYVAISGNYVYFFSNENGYGKINIIDISTPSTPQEVGFIDLGIGDYRDFAVNGNYIYVADGYNGLNIFDVSNPSSPQKAGFFKTGDYAQDVVFANDYIFLADRDDGLYIIQNDLLLDIDEKSSFSPISFSLAQNYPNPFNPSTKFNYSISHQGYVTLKVYDILGNEIETLVNEEKPTGNYEVDFDGGNLASGVYFYQLRTGSFVKTKKMVLLK